MLLENKGVYPGNLRVQQLSAPTLNFVLSTVVLMKRMDLFFVAFTFVHINWFQRLEGPKASLSISEKVSSYMCHCSACSKLSPTHFIYLGSVNRLFPWATLVTLDEKRRAEYLVES